MKCFISNSVLAAGLTLLSVASYGQTPINSVPYTISAPGTYILANNLTYSGANGNAITVNADHVSIDLNRYYLYCPTSNNFAIGICAISKADVQVRNGFIGGFWIGVNFSGGNSNFDHLVDGIRFSQNTYAVVFVQTKACVVQNCQIIGPGRAGVWFNSGTGNRAANNVATGLTYGFASDGTDYFDSNYADNCSSYGIWAGSATTKFRFNTTTNCATNVLGGTEEFAGDN
jgi:hypothetical protein